VYVYLPVQDNVPIPEAHTLRSADDELQARVELLEQQLERTHRLLQAAEERDRETRRLLAAALERIPSQLELPADEREAPETVEAAPERSEASKELPLWAYGLGVFLVGLTDPLLQFSPSWFPGNPNIHGGFGNTDATVGPLIFLGVLPESIKMVLAFSLPVLLPIGFGYVIGWRSEGPKIWRRLEVPSRFWRRVLLTWLLITVISFLPWNILQGLMAFSVGMPYFLITPWEALEMSSWWIPVGLAFFSGALLGNSRRRRVAQQDGGSILSPRVENFVGFAGIILTGFLQILAALVGNLSAGA
jgi:hypothetical protein